MGKKYVEDIWRLFRKRCNKTYKFKEISADLIRKEKRIPVFPVLGVGQGDVTAYQSHSARSAWVYKPWKDGKTWYTGFEYKGVGYEGTKIRRFAGTAWGGAYTENAMVEHRFSKMAFDGGVFCQRPVAVYDYGLFYGKPIAVVVRAFVSPLRLSDFMFENRFYSAYLDIRGETAKEHCDSISTLLGKNVRRLLDLGIYHGTMGINNITSEGEIADFEPTSGGTWEGLLESQDPFFRYISISRVLNAGKTFFPKYRKDFNQNFADAFFGRRVELDSIKPAREIAERYCKTKIDVTRRTGGEKPPAELRKAIRMVKALRRSAKTAVDRKIYDYVLDTITNPPE